MEDVVLQVSKGTIDINMIFKKIEDHRAEEVLKAQEKEGENGKARG